MAVDYLQAKERTQLKRKSDMVDITLLHFASLQELEFKYYTLNSAVVCGQARLVKVVFLICLVS